MSDYHKELIKEISNYVGSIQIHHDNFRTLSITFECSQRTFNNLTSDVIEPHNLNVLSINIQRIGNRGEGVQYRYTMVIVF